MVKRMLRAFVPLSVVAAVAFTAVPTPAGAAAPAPDPLRGLVEATTGPCAGTLTSAASPACLPEPLDAARFGAADASPLPSTVANAQLLATPPTCTGTGADGPRVEVIYAYNNNKPSRLNTFALSFRAWLSMVDDVYLDSAARFGASRKVRWLTEPAGGSCRVVIREVGLSPAQIGTWAGARTALRALGYQHGDRKYLIIGDPQVAEGDPSVCGLGEVYPDAQTGPANRNNLGDTFARVDAPCWGSNALAHEVEHMMGAVLDAAPNGDKGHCKDEWDLMCYPDEQGEQLRLTCLERDIDRLFDCNGDDYFNPNPPAGSPLTRYWNTANNDFLIKGSTPQPTGAGTGVTYVIRNVATGNAMDVANSSTNPGEVVTQRPVSGARSQQWLLDYAAAFRLMNNNSGYCAESYSEGVHPGTPFVQNHCGEGNHSQWSLHPVGGGRYALLHNKSGLALTPRGASPEPLEIQPYTGATNQQWQLTRVSAPAQVSARRYWVRGFAAGGTTLDVQGTPANGAPIIVDTAGPSTPSADLSQEFAPAALSGGNGRLSNAERNNCVRPRGGTATAGNTLELTTCGTAGNQIWRYVRVSDERYMLIHRDSNLAITRVGGAGTTVQLRPLVGTSDTMRNMTWYFRPVS